MACPPLNIYLTGHGKMGNMIEQLAHQKGLKITQAIEDSDVVIDFSHRDVVLNNIKIASNLKKPIIVGTTGWDEQIEDAKQLVERCHNALLYSPNFSLGVYFFLKIVEKTASLLESFPEYGVKGIEMHHKDKADAPSGTAKKIASQFKKEVSFASVRTGSIVGKHTLILDSFCDTISLTHEAQSREGFAMGALHAAEWIKDKKGWFTLDDIFRPLHSSCNPV